MSIRYVFKWNDKDETDLKNRGCGGYSRGFDNVSLEQADILTEVVPNWTYWEYKKLGKIEKVGVVIEELS